MFCLEVGLQTVLPACLEITLITVIFQSFMNCELVVCQFTILSSLEITLITVIFPSFVNYEFVVFQITLRSSLVFTLITVIYMDVKFVSLWGTCLREVISSSARQGSRNFQCGLQQGFIGSKLAAKMRKNFQ